MNRLLRLWAAGLLVVWAGVAHADTEQDRFSSAGYFRVMTRPDLQGGNGALGYWNLYGRLLNEGPWVNLEPRLQIVQSEPGSDEPWATVGARIEGGSIGQADPGMGGLTNFRIAQFFVQAGNVLLEDVTWRLGTQEFYHGDLGLYDFRPTNLFLDTLGLSANYQHDKTNLIVMVGDAGYSIRGSNYSTILTAGAWYGYHFNDHFEAGVGGQIRYEPEVKGDKNAPYYTPGITYEAYLRHEIVKDFLEQHPGQENLFPNPVPTDANSWLAVAYVGFGGFGPVKWNNFYANVMKKHPEAFTTETYNGRTYDIFIKQLTDQRYAASVGDQIELTIVPNLIDVAWAAYLEYDDDKDNTLQPGDNNRLIYSSVIRGQYYFTKVVHELTEVSVAREHSTNGNAYREHSDSIFSNTAGVPDTRGFEFGDADTRNTIQIKSGFVISPSGMGIFARPELRLLYGLQYSSQQAAFGNGFNQSLNQYNQFVGPERHWHSVISVEAEGWF